MISITVIVCDSFKLEKRCELFFRSYNETLSVAAECINEKDRSLTGNCTPQGELLEQPEDFEDDHDNDNHSNYVKDVSAHAGDSYQIARAMVNIT